MVWALPTDPGAALSHRAVPAMLSLMAGMIWDLFLFFVGLGLAALGVINSSTSLIWFGVAALCLVALVAHRGYIVLKSRRSTHAAASDVTLEFEGMQIGHIQLHQEIARNNGGIATAPRIESHAIEIAWVSIRNPGKTPRHDAREVMAVISVTRPDGGSFDFQGRWRQSLERRDVQSLVEISDRIVIPAARRSTLDVAFRYQGESSAYCVNTESTELAPDWRYKRWELPPGEYLVKVEITGDNVRPLTGWFRLENPVDGSLSLRSSPAPKRSGGVSIVLADLIPDAQIVAGSGWTSRVGSGWTASGVANGLHGPSLDPLTQARRHDEEVATAPILKVGKPSFTYGSRELTLDVENTSSAMAFSPRLRLRASKQPVGPPDWQPAEGAAELVIPLPDAIAPGDRASFRGVLTDFVAVPPPPGEIPLWPSQIICDLTTSGFLGQQVLQRYEWAPRGRDGHYFWQRVVEVIPTDGVPARPGS